MSHRSDHQPPARFDTGMTYAEATRRAKKWWGQYRGAVRADFNREKAKPKVWANSRKVPGLIVRGEETETVPSGILSGKHWNKLSEREKILIVVQWHHEHIRVPTVELDRHVMNGGVIQ